MSVIFPAQETYSVVKVFNGELGEALVNQVHFTFSWNGFEPVEVNTIILRLWPPVFVRFEVSWRTVKADQTGKYLCAQTYWFNRQHNV